SADFRTRRALIFRNDAKLRPAGPLTSWSFRQRTSQPPSARLASISSRTQPVEIVNEALNVRPFQIGTAGIVPKNRQLFRRGLLHESHGGDEQHLIDSVDRGGILLESASELPGEQFERARAIAENSVDGHRAVSLVALYHGLAVITSGHSVVREAPRWFVVAT